MLAHTTLSWICFIKNSEKKKERTPFGGWSACYAKTYTLKIVQQMLAKRQINNQANKKESAERLFNLTFAALFGGRCPVGLKGRKSPGRPPPPPPPGGDRSGEGEGSREEN